MGATVNHAFTSPVADVTGTITVLNTNGITATAAASQIIRPSNWNEEHIVAIDGFAGTGFSGTNISGTVDSNGISLSVSPGGGAGDGYNIVGINGNSVGSAVTVQFSNFNNVTFGLAGSTVTASASYPAQTAYVFSNSNGVSFGTNGSTITATVKTDYLTTARASNDAVGLNTALTAGPLAWTVNSAGISLNASNAAGTTSGFAGNSISGSMTHNTAGLNISLNHPAWLTTAAQSNHSHGNPTLNLTNLSGTTASASNGVTFSLSAGAIPTVTQYFSATNTTFNGANISGSMTLNTNGLQLSLSAPTPGGGGAINVSAGTTSGNLQTIQFNDANGVSFGLDGSTVTASINAGGGNLASFWQPVPFNNTTTLAPIGAGTIVVWPAFQEGAASFSRGIVYISNSVSSSSNSSHAGNISLYLGIYTRNGSTLSLASSGSQSYQWTNTSNNSLASIASIRGLTVPINASFNGGDIWCAMMSRTSTTNANWFTARHIIASGMTNQLVGNIGEATNVSRQMLPGWGQYSTTSSALPASMAFSNIRGIGSGASNVGISPYINFVNMTA